MSKRKFEQLKAKLAVAADGVKRVAEREATDPQADVNDILSFQDTVSEVVSALDKLIWRNG